MRTHLHGWHPGISPAVHQAGLDKPCELALGQHSVDEAESAVVPDVDPGQTRPHILLSLEHPVELVLYRHNLRSASL